MTGVFMSQGFIQLHRKILDEWFWKNPNSGHLMTTFLLLANHQEKQVLFEGEKRSIMRGELITTQRDLVDITTIPKTTIKRTIDTLIDGKEIIKIKTKATHIRILRYDHFMTDSFDQRWTKGEPLKVLNNNDNNDNNNTNNQTDVKSVYEEIFYDESFIESVKNKFRLNDEQLEDEIDHMYHSFSEKNKISNNWKSSLKTWLYSGRKIEKNYIQREIAKSNAYDNPE